MKSFKARKYLIVAVLSVVLSLAIIRWHSQDGVPFCVNSAGCSARETLRGKVTTTTYGFPATYRQVEKFNPANTNPSSGGYPGYAEAKNDTQGLSVFKLVTNIVFWFALLQLLSRLARSKRQTLPVALPAVPARPAEPNPSTGAVPDASKGK